MRVVIACALALIVAAFPATAAAAPSAVIEPSPDDASSQKWEPLPRTYTVRSTGDPFVGRLRGSDLGATRSQRPTIASFAQQQFQVAVPAGATSISVAIGNPAVEGTDLDLFLFNCSTGTCVLSAQSAGGTATESVTRANPPAGTWVILVDGFSVPGGGSTAFDIVDTYVSPAFGRIATVANDEPHPTGSTWSVPATLTPMLEPPVDRQLTGEVSVVTDTGAVIARAPVSFRIDTTPPDTTITGPNGLVNTRRTTFELGSSEARSTFTCAVDGGQPVACDSPFTTPSLQDGVHQITVTAIDPAGNVDPSPISQGFAVDATAPTPTITAGPSAVGRDRTPTVAFTVDDSTASASCRADDGAFAPCTSPYTAGELEDAGRHTIEVRATDRVGNHGIVTTAFVITAPTALAARTAQVAAGRIAPAATLTHWRTGAPVRGRAIAFTAAGRAICTATTDDAGTATCSAPLSTTATEYTATFEGDAEFAAVGARGALSFVQAACTSPEKLTLRVKRGKQGSGLRVRQKLGGARLVKAVLVNRGGRRVRTLKTRGMRVTVDLAGLPAGAYTVRATIRLKSGKLVAASRRVAAC